MSRDQRKYEALGRELERLRADAVRHISRLFGLKRYEAERRVNEALVAWNVVKDRFRWGLSDEILGRGSRDEEGSTG